MVGKLIGALVGIAMGLLVSLPAPFVVGLMVLTTLAGHLLIDGDSAAEREQKRKSRPIESFPVRVAPSTVKTATPEQRQLIALLCPMFIEYARIDGPVVQTEIRVIREYFESLQFGDAALEEVRVALKEAMARPPMELDALARAARSAVTPAQRPDLLKALYDLALIDSDIRRSESDALRVIVQQFNLSEEQLQKVTREFFGTGEAHFQTLGLKLTATDDEIRSAFRRLAAENHPDRAASLGAAEAEAAAERFRTVKNAFDELKKLRGL